MSKGEFQQSCGFASSTWSERVNRGESPITANAAVHCADYWQERGYDITRLEVLAGWGIIELPFGKVTGDVHAAM